MKINPNLQVASQSKIKKGNKAEIGETLQNLVPKDGVTVSYYRQDPYVGGPELTKIPKEGLRPGPDNERIDTRASVKPNEDGNMIFAPSTPEFVSVQTFTSTDKTMRVIQHYLGRKINWSFGKEQLAINPDKGEMKNAYYSRWEGTTNFFHYLDKLGKLIHTGKSFEIVSHETGHALLDGMHPGYMGWSKEPMGIHEGFADITAIIAGLHDERTIDQFLKETGGDFRKDNVISNMGEEFGASIYGKPCLRSAINNFTYSPPDSLPDHPAPGELGGEAHSFGQLLVGTFYDVLEGVYKASVGEGMSPKEALIKARDVAGELFIKGIDEAPPNNARYKDVALGMLQVGKRKGARYNELMENIFKNRKILSEADIQESNNLNVNRSLVFLSSSNEEGIVDFVESNREMFGIDKEIPIKLDRVRKNDDGSEMFDVTYNQEVTLTGSDYGMFNGATVEMEAGITLATESSGQLCNMSHSNISKEDIDNVKKDMKDYIKEGLIKFVDPSQVGKLKEEDLFDSKGRPYIGFTTYDGGKMKIVRSPIIV